MSFLVKGIKKLVVGPLLGGLFGSKKKPAQTTMQQATRDDARALADREMELARRRGAASDIITGTTGAEAAAGSIGRLVVGS